jgi:hypothetical protein
MLRFSRIPSDRPSIGQEGQKRWEAGSGAAAAAGGARWMQHGWREAGARWMQHAQRGERWTSDKDIAKGAHGDAGGAVEESKLGKPVAKALLTTPANRLDHLP